MEEVSNLILKGLLKDLLIAERSFLLNRSINQTSITLTNSNKKAISEILYDLTYTEMVLAICRLFDHPSKKYKTRCIKQLYTLIEERNFECQIINKKRVIEMLPHFGFPAEFQRLLSESSTFEFNKRALMFFQSEEINKPIAPALEEIKEKRDKLLSHNEEITLNTFIPYTSFETLLDYAKNVLSFFALTYAGFELKPTGDFYLTGDSHKWEIVYERFKENGG